MQCKFSSRSVACNSWALKEVNEANIYLGTYVALISTCQWIPEAILDLCDLPPGFIQSRTKQSFCFSPMVSSHCPFDIKCGVFPRRVSQDVTEIMYLSIHLICHHFLPLTQRHRRLLGSHSFLCTHHDAIVGPEDNEMNRKHFHSMSNVGASLLMFLQNIPSLHDVYISEIQPSARYKKPWPSSSAQLLNRKSALIPL